MADVVQPTSHQLTINFDESTGVITVRHRCRTLVVGHVVTHARDYVLGPENAATLKGLIDANRKLMEDEAVAMSVDHVSALNKVNRPGVKQLYVGGTLSIGRKAPEPASDGQ